MPPTPLIISLKVTNQAQAKAQIAAVLSGGGNIPGGKGGGAGGGLGGLGAFYIARHVIGGLVSAIEGLVNAAEDASREILNIKDILGSTFQQAAGITMMFQTVGMSGSQGAKLAEKLAQDVQRPEARAAMNRLHVNVANGESGAQIFKDFIKGLQGMKDGTQKAALAIAVFGQRGYLEMLPLLRMSKDIAEESEKLGEAWKDEYANKIERFQEKVSLLGKSFMVSVVVPLLSAVIPAIVNVIDFISRLLEKFRQINDFFGGTPAFVIAFVGVAAAIGLTLIALGKMLVLLKASALWAAVLDAFEGNWGAIAAGAAVGAGVGIWQHQMDTNDKIEENTRATADAIMDLHADIIGGGGKYGNRSVGSMEAEYAIRNAFRLA